MSHEQESSHAQVAPASYRQPDSDVRSVDPDVPAGGVPRGGAAQWVAGNHDGGVPDLGLFAGDAYDMTFDFVSQTPYSDAFMGAEHPKIRFVGHGVGLEADEYPFIAEGH